MQVYLAVSSCPDRKFNHSNRYRKIKSIEIIDERRDINFELSVNNANHTSLQATLDNDQALISSQSFIEQNSLDWLTLRATEHVSGQHLDQLIPVFNSSHDNLTGHQRLLDDALILSSYLRTSEGESVNSMILPSQTESILDVDQSKSITDLQDSELMVRHAFGTYPGLSLQQNLNEIDEYRNSAELLSSLNQLMTYIEVTSRSKLESGKIHHIPCSRPDSGSTTRPR